MNITVIYPNRRKQKSTTYSIAQTVTEKLSQGGEVYEFFMPTDMPHVCVGCYACFAGHSERCGGYEYLKPIIAAMEKSQLIIFCSPSYVFHTPGQIKTLLDHFGYRWIVHSPDLSFMKKQALIITSAAGGGIHSAMRDVRDSLNYWGIARVYTISHAVWGYDWTNMPESFMKKIMRKITRTTDKILRDEKHLTPSLKVKALFYVYRLFHKGRKMAPTDDNYWYEKGYTTKKPWKD